MLGAPERNAYVDTKHIAIGPAVCRMKGIDEAVAFIDPVSEHAAHFHQGRDANLGSEHERTARGARHNRAVDGTLCRRAAPSFITLGAVGSRDAPNVLRIARALCSKVDAKLAMGQRGLD